VDTKPRLSRAAQLKRSQKNQIETTHHGGSGITGIAVVFGPGAQSSKCQMSRCRLPCRFRCRCWCLIKSRWHYRPRGLIMSSLRRRQKCEAQNWQLPRGRFQPAGCIMICQLAGLSSLSLRFHILSRFQQVSPLLISRSVCSSSADQQQSIGAELLNPYAPYTVPAAPACVPGAVREQTQR